MDAREQRRLLRRVVPTFSLRTVLDGTGHVTGYCRPAIGAWSKGSRAVTRFKAAKEASDTPLMRSLGQEVFTELTVDTAIEEETFYPWAAGLTERSRR